MRLPRKVKIGPTRYVVTASPDSLAWAEKRESKSGKTFLDGYISFRHKTIVLNTKDCTRHNVQFSLAHEVVHGILDMLGYGHEWQLHYGNEEYEEGFVDRFATAWLNVMRENPTLVNYLMEDE